MICVDLPRSRINDGRETIVGAFVEQVTGGKQIGVGGKVGGAGGFGRSLLLLSLIEVAFDHRDGGGRILG